MLLEMFLVGRMWTDATFSGTQETYIKLAKSNGFLFFLRLLRFHSSIWERIEFFLNKIFIGEKFCCGGMTKSKVITKWWQK